MSWVPDSSAIGRRGALLQVFDVVGFIERAAVRLGRELDASGKDRVHHGDQPEYARYAHMSESSCSETAIRASGITEPAARTLAADRE